VFTNQQQKKRYPSSDKGKIPKKRPDRYGMRAGAATEGPRLRILVLRGGGADLVGEKERGIRSKAGQLFGEGSLWKELVRTEAGGGIFLKGKVGKKGVHSVERGKHEGIKQLVAKGGRDSSTPLRPFLPGEGHSAS